MIQPTEKNDDNDDIVQWVRNGIAVRVFGEAADASNSVAAEIASLIRQRADDGEQCILGLATGSTPVRVYRELIRLHREENLSMKNVVTFNLDEYFPMKPNAAQSYVRFMNEQLFDHVDISPDNIHIPDGTVTPDRVTEYCQQYEDAIDTAGGIDLQLLGIGRTGHVGFNEPGSEQASTTRLVRLCEITRTDAAKDFGGLEKTPQLAITMGVGTILRSRRIRLLAFGEHKSAIVERSVQGAISDSVPATYLHDHGNVEFVLDSAAASKLNPSTADVSH
ncbi:glucosamine-6-phosphate deaminase [Novipirellula maiorica]|uniref:glucosamine-6-phosphate deaminase n=1 Tax=Novipirellula maiorica TaxID=1265734 RepID=UPI001EECFFA8|nr:glucosamine-6-phosphate deaminase [Rhodopirellula maiorica]